MMKSRATSILPSLTCGLLMLGIYGCNSKTDSQSGTGGLVVAGACASTAALAPPPAPDPGAPPAGLSLKRTQINTGFTLSFPLFLTAPPGDTARLFVVEKGGTIKIVDRATNALIGTFLDVMSLVSTGGEQGLLGLAFDPQYASNGRFYVSYTDKAGIGNSVIARYLVNPNNPDLAVPTADRIILTLPQPFENHNGGMIAFGSDGYLYLSFGDGGSGGDPGNRAQNLGEQLGKLLRIDVRQGAVAPQPAYGVPADNPCVGQAGAKEEIWSMGLRNPWRWSFDRVTGDLYIADVGQDTREEVNVVGAASGAGRGTNFGWRITEGNSCYPSGTACIATGLWLPFVEYLHPSGCSVTGGYVYRGTAIPALQGTYFYADYCAGFVRSFRMVNGAVTEHANWTALSGGNIPSFGEDAAGELYILTAAGGLYRIESN